MKNKELTPPLIFNLGRVWQSALCDDWSEAERVCALIEETGTTDKDLKQLKNAVHSENIEDVDGSLNKILKW